MVRQLKMVWKVSNRPQVSTLPEGYKLRSYHESDKNQYITLMEKSGFTDFHTIIDNVLKNPLSPTGIFFVTYEDTLVATACALEKDKQSAELGWVAVDPEHRGKKLSLVTCTSVINFLLDKKYNEIFLLTDHWRTAAIKIYLKLGFEPVHDSAADRFLWADFSE